MKLISDVGRLVAVPVFAIIMAPNAATLYRDLQTLFPVNMSKVTSLGNHLVLFCFYTLIILLYLMRKPAKSSSKSFVANAIAIMTSFMPLFLFNIAGKTPSSATLIVADLIILSGMGFAIYSLTSLGQSFSIIPQARKLVQKGPYRVVRHPLYLAELMSILGIVLLNVTIPNVAAFLLLTMCQIYRSLREEQLLEEVFPEYKEYRSRTCCLIPGIL